MGVEFVALITVFVAELVALLIDFVIA